MSTDQQPTPSPRSPKRIAAAAAIALGLVAGGYTIASAANGGSTTPQQPTAPPQMTQQSQGSGAQGYGAPPQFQQSQGSAQGYGTPPQGAPQGGPGGQGGAPWGHQRSDETVLTGDAAAKVTAVAKAKLPNAEIIRVETDADGVAKYEAHVVKADGTPATVFVSADFQFVSIK